jgi:DNA polymerase-3 subunit delta
MATASTTTPHKALNTALATRQFAPVYYFHGDDDFLKDAAVQAVVEAAVEPSGRDFNVDVARGGEVDAEGLETMLSTLPMLSERRAVVLRDVQGLKKAVRGVLDRYVARPASDTVLVCTTPAGVKPDASLAKQATAYAFEPLTEERTRRWVAHHARERLGRAIDEDAADLLVQAAGTDLQALASELDKLASFATGDGGTTIDAAAVSAVVGVRRGETMADLLDAVAARDAARAVDMLPFVLAQPKTSGVQLVMALGTQFLALSYCVARQGERVPPARLSAELFQLMKEGAAYTGRPWGEAQQAWMRAASGWTPAQLAAAIDRLHEADLALKETRVSSELQLLSTLVLALCA